MKKSNKSSKNGRKQAKKKYKVRNWREYNQMLVNRGSIYFWMEEAAKENWNRSPRTGKRGKPEDYSDMAIETCLTFRHLFSLSLRATEGFVNSLFKMSGVTLSSPDYSTLSLRAGTLSVNIRAKKQDADKALHIVVDSSGAKVYGEGEWKVRQHGWSKHRTWRKFHLGIDEETGTIQAAELTENGVADCEMLEPLLRQINNPIDQVSADGGYDKKMCYDVLDDLGIIAAIPPQKNAKIWRHGNIKKDTPHARDKNLRRIREVGRQKWKEEVDYHRRSIAENTMFRFKTIFGDIIASRIFPNQRTEVLLKCKILNKMTEAGRPESYLVG